MPHNLVKDWRKRFGVLMPRGKNLRKCTEAVYDDCAEQLEKALKGKIVVETHELTHLKHIDNGMLSGANNNLSWEIEKLVRRGWD